MLFGARLFDSLELSQGSFPARLIVLQNVLAAIRPFAHEIHGFLAKLITAHGSVVAVAKGLSIAFGGASTDSERKCQKC